MKHLQRFFSSDASGGIILIFAAALAMLLANTDATSGIYHSFLETPVQLRVGALEINKNMLLWINDALMAVFFLLIGLEVKREMIQGALASRRQAVFPVVAALGGMIVPALIYLAFNAQDPIIREGWAIPAATDIAFALGVLALLGSRVPPALKIFLMALAIIDDLGAIIIIALFYTSDLSVLSLGVAAGAIAVLVALNLCGVRRTGIYILVGAVLWTAVLKSGVHATLAGVIVGFMIPLKELGGKSPLIVCEDASLDLAADIAMMANFYSSGQVCTNGTRVFVPTRLKAAFEEKILARVARIRPGDLFAESTNFGPLVSFPHRDNVLRYIETGKQEGARLLCGGEALKGDGFDNGAWVAPTVFTDCNDEMTIVREEIFGPVMSILSYTDEAEVIRRANATEYGLAAGVVTPNLNRAHRLIHQLEAGICWINSWGESPAEMPVGGYKHSGIGRENGVMTLQSYTQVKSIQVEMGKFQSIF